MYLRRFWRQIALGARMDVLLLLGSPAQILLWTVTDVLAYAGGIVAVLLLAERFNGIAGWSQPQLVLLVGYSTTVSGLQSTFFGYNVAAISRRIGRGQLDHTLVQPQPLLLAFLTEGFSPFSALGILLPGVVLMGLAVEAGAAAVTATLIGKLAISLAASTVIVLAGAFAIGAAAFWAPRGAEEISTRAHTLLSLTQFPLDPVPRAIRTALVTVIPAGLVAWFPTGALVGRRPEWQWVLTPVVAVVGVAIATLIFKKGLRHYARTGSHRYSTFGHRR
jgi:ABC-2 type transport system permease protein